MDRPDGSGNLCYMWHGRLFSLLIFISVVAGQAANAELISADASAQEESSAWVKAYAQAWSVIKNQYHDRTFNSQDWTRWQHRYDHHLHTSSDCRKAIETMLASLGDRNTRYLPAEDFDDGANQIVARFFGVGLSLQSTDVGTIRIVSPIRGTPAARAGLATSDEIVAINGKSVVGLSLWEAVQRIRGPKGTTVNLAVLRRNRRKSYNLTRAEILVRDVSAVAVMGNRIGYLRIDTLMGVDTIRCVKESLADLRKARALVLDLRNNPGGLLTNAIELTRLFVDEGTIVSSVNAEGSATHEVCNKSAIWKKPLVVLVNEGTASSAEISAAALRDNKRAVLVGRRTFGKGRVQSISRLFDGGGINFWTARYLSPNNRKIEGGVWPDVQIMAGASSSDFTRDAQLAKAIEIAELRAKAIK